MASDLGGGCSDLTRRLGARQISAAAAARPASRMSPRAASALWLPLLTPEPRLRACSSSSVAARQAGLKTKRVSFTLHFQHRHLWQRSYTAACIQSHYACDAVCVSTRRTDSSGLGRPLVLSIDQCSYYAFILARVSTLQILSSHAERKPVFACELRGRRGK